MRIRFAGIRCLRWLVLALALFIATAPTFAKADPKPQEMPQLFGVSASGPFHSEPRHFQHPLADR